MKPCKSSAIVGFDELAQQSAWSNIIGQSKAHAGVTENNNIFVSTSVLCHYFSLFGFQIKMEEVRKDKTLK